MNQNYWKCPFHDHDSTLKAPGEYNAEYGCTHPAGTGLCDKENKQDNQAADCLFLDIKHDVSLCIIMFKINNLFHVEPWSILSM